MNNLLYIIALILLVLWAIGYFGYDAGKYIHALIIVAVIVIIVRLIKGNDRPLYK
jgi:predicted ferric reductase